MAPRIIDSFTYFNEHRLLLLRLRYLHDAVDRFIISEASVTHQGTPKELSAYNTVVRYFPEILHKTEFVHVFDMPIGKGHSANWMREHYQREAIQRKLNQFSQDDLVVVSDLDEIPNKETLDAIRREPGFLDQGTASLSMKMYLYSAYNRLYIHSKPAEWNHPKISKLESLCSPQWLRKSQSRYSINNSGWHLTYMGGSFAVKTKISSFAHSEYANSAVYETLDSRIDSIEDPFGRDGHELRKEELEGVLTPEIRSEFKDILSI